MSNSEPAYVTAIIETLLAEQAERISLDRVAEAVGAAPITFDEIETVLERLEAAGRKVEAETLDPPAALAKVLAAVRSFSALSGRRPTLAEIAQHSGLALAEVRFALLYARVLTR